MSEMVERVARAIALADLDPETRAAVDPDVWFVAESYYALARAALEAMREPTQDMLLADPRRDMDLSEESWAAMIDAALKD